MNESTLTHLTSTDSEKMCMCVRLCMACVCVCVWRFLIVSSLPPSVTLLLPPSLTLSPSLSLSLALAPSVKSPCRDAQNHSCHWACSMQAQLSHRGARAASTCPLLLPWQAPQNWRSPPCQTTAVRRWNCLGATPPRRGTAAAGQLYCRDAWCADMQWPVLMLIHTHTHVDTHEHKYAKITCTYTYVCFCTTTSTGNATTPKYSKSRNCIPQYKFKLNQTINLYGTNSNWTNISTWISTARYQGIWISWFSEFRGCYMLSYKCTRMCTCTHASIHTWVYRHIQQHTYTQTYSNDPERGVT